MEGENCLRNKDEPVLESFCAEQDLMLTPLDTQLHAVFTAWRTCSCSFLSKFFFFLQKSNTVYSSRTEKIDGFDSLWAFLRVVKCMDNNSNNCLHSFPLSLSYFVFIQKTKPQRQCVQLLSLFFVLICNTLFLGISPLYCSPVGPDDIGF